MPLVYSFYPEESIVSLSSKFQFSGLRMSSVDPLAKFQVGCGWIGPVPICLCNGKNFIKKNGSSLEVRVLNPISDFLN